MKLSIFNQKVNFINPINLKKNYKKKFSTSLKQFDFNFLFFCEKINNLNTSNNKTNNMYFFKSIENSLIKKKVNSKYFFFFLVMSIFFKFYKKILNLSEFISINWFIANLNKHYINNYLILFLYNSFASLSFLSTDLLNFFFRLKKKFNKFVFVNPTTKFLPLTLNLNSPIKPVFFAKNRFFILYWLFLKNHFNVRRISLKKRVFFFYYLVSFFFLNLGYKVKPFLKNESKLQNFTYNKLFLSKINTTLFLSLRLVKGRIFLASRRKFRRKQIRNFFLGRAFIFNTAKFNLSTVCNVFFWQNKSFFKGVVFISLFFLKNCIFKNKLIKNKPVSLLKLLTRKLKKKKQIFKRLINRLNFKSKAIRKIVRRNRFRKVFFSLKKKLFLKTSQYNNSQTMKFLISSTLSEVSLNFFFLYYLISHSFHFNFINLFNNLFIKNSGFVNFLKTTNYLYFYKFVNSVTPILFLPTNVRFFLRKTKKNRLREEFSLLFRQYFGGFFESLTFKKIFLKVSTKLLISRKTLRFIKILTYRHKNHQQHIGRGFFLNEMLLIFWYAFYQKDINFLMDWIIRTMHRIEFKKHKSFVRVLKFFLHRYSWFFLKNTKVKGVRFDIRGKLGVRGNAKKRHFSFNINTNSFSKKKHRLEFKQGLVHTDTGVLGLTLVIAF